MRSNETSNKDLEKVLEAARKRISDLEMSEERFRFLVENSPDIIMIQDLSGIVTFISDQLHKMLGYSPEDFLGKGLPQYIHPEDKEMVRKELLRGIQSLVSVTIEYRMYDACQRVLWLSHTSRPIFKNGDVIGIQSSIRNITENKKAEEALRLSEQRFRGLFETMTEGVAIHEILLDENGSPKDYEIIDVNLAYSNHTGLEMNKAIGYKASELYGTGKPPYFDLYSRVAETGIPVNFETYFEPMNKYFRISIFSPEKLKFATIFEDITQKKQLEEELIESENRFRYVLDNIQLIAIQLDIYGNLIYCNDYFLKEVGWERDEVIGANWFACFLSEEDAVTVETVRSFVEGHSKEISYFENSIITKEGKKILIAWNNISLRDTKGNIIGLTSIGEDITEKRQLDDQLKALNYSLEQKVHERTEQLNSTLKEMEAFNYSVSHDLRTPLRSMTGFSKIILEDYGNQLDKTAKNYLQRINEAGNRMGLLIDGLLNLSRLSRKDLAFQRVNLSNIVQSYVGNFVEQEPKRDIQFIIAENLVVDGDRELLQMAVHNLLGNSCKYTSHHEKAIIEFGMFHQGKRKIYFIKDDGAGFNMAYMNKLFLPFQRLHGNKEFEGLGIGLSTVQRIIQRHGGEIWAEGEVEKGATFYFTFSRKKKGVERSKKGIENCK